MATNAKLRSKVWNTLSAMERVTKGQSFNLPSLTIPDQTMSMRTIIERYATGMPLNMGRSVIWEDPENPGTGLNPKTLDLVDLQEISERNQQTIKDLEEQVLAERDKRKQIHAEELRRKSEDDLKAKWRKEETDKKPA